MKPKKSEKRRKKKFLGIHFRCCTLYGRVYKNKEGTAYEGICPGCGRKAVVPIGKDGSTSRFFIAK